jgi:nitrogen fixation/metabolism regulation signal transduction histidine kinase
MLARQPATDRRFTETAVKIIVSEIETLERRVQAFSEFSREPDANITTIDVAALVSERIALISSAYPSTHFELMSSASPVFARADADLVKGILTNTVQNAADAAGTGGQVLVVVDSAAGASVASTAPEPAEYDDPSAVRIAIEVHDSGAGLPDGAELVLFEPTISFKQGGMGLGLSIAKRNALACGGDIVIVPGRLGGAAFRVTLPACVPA